MKEYRVPCIADRIIDKYKNKEQILRVSVPGSKSITNRALLLAALSDTKAVLDGCLFSDDSRNFLKCIQALGIETQVDEEKNRVTITGCGGKIPASEASIYVGSAGTAARFITAVLGLSEGSYYIDASEQMRKRPMEPLFTALEELGCTMEWESPEQKYHFPVRLISHGLGKDSITINIDKSSQFLSALMIASVMSKEDFTINIEGSHGMAYIDMTSSMMKQFGVNCQKTDTGYVIKKGQAYHRESYTIEPDYSAAAYFYSMSPIFGIAVNVPGYRYDSLQGDIALIETFKKMGCLPTVSNLDESIILYPPADGIIHGLTVDMSAFSDQAITLAAVSVFADSPTVITGIGHIRLQECDRLYGIASELTRIGIKVDEKQDRITIYPPELNIRNKENSIRETIIETYNDHRMAMGLSLLGLRIPGIIINDPLCCRKTFENYFDIFDRLCLELTGQRS